MSSARQPGLLLEIFYVRKSSVTSMTLTRLPSWSGGASNIEDHKSSTVLRGGKQWSRQPNTNGKTEQMDSHKYVPPVSRTNTHLHSLYSTNSTHLEQPTCSIATYTCTTLLDTVKKFQIAIRDQPFLVLHMHQHREACKYNLRNRKTGKHVNPPTFRIQQTMP